MSKASRTHAIQTPGVDPAYVTGDAAGATEGDAGSGEQASAGSVEDELPPDVQRLIDKRVADALAAQRHTEARAKLNPATGRTDLPTQEEALAQVKADPKRRAILSRDGYVTAPAVVKQRDESGFAKA